MSVLQTVLIFVVAPLAVVLIITGLVYAGGSRRARRYRPGRPFEFTPVWFLSAPEQQLSTMDHHEGTHRAGIGGAHRAEVEAKRSIGVLTDHEELSGDEAVAHAGLPSDSVAAQHGETGGASDRW